MSDELIRELAQVGNLRVNSPTSAMSYKEHKETLPQIAHELSVDAVLQGSVVLAMMADSLTDNKANLDRITGQQELNKNSSSVSRLPTN